MSHQWSDEVDTDAVLVGAEAYQRMLDDCEARLQLSASRIEGYEGTRDTLKALLRTCQQDLMVPVAGGLAYFEGTIRHTNNVLVLLGENLFAERSVHDALGVSERRIGYLKAERTALEAEKKEIVDKQRLFIECGVVGSESDDKVSRGRQGRPKATTPSSPSFNNATSKPSSSSSSLPPSTNAVVTPHHQSNSKDQTATSSGHEGGGEDYEEEALEGEEEEEDDNIIDPQDELTLDELIALEEELGADIDDEEKAEAAIMALVNKKKALRIAQQAAVSTTTATATAISTSQEQKEDEKEKCQDPSHLTSCTATATASCPLPAAQQQCRVESEGKSNLNSTDDHGNDVNNSGGLGMSLTAAATAFVSPADIGKLFQNIGGAAGDVKDGFEEHLTQRANVNTCILNQPSASTPHPPASSTIASQNSVPTEKAEPAFVTSTTTTPSMSPPPAIDIVKSFATATASPAVKETSIELPPISRDWFRGGGGSHVAHGPLKDLIVERNISGAMGAIGEESSSVIPRGGRSAAAAVGGGVVGMEIGNNIAASSQPPVGNASSTVTVKKRSLFGQGMGLK